VFAEPAPPGPGASECAPNAKGRALGPAFDEIDLLNGAGDEIRTHDPNLGKIWGDEISK